MTQRGIPGGVQRFSENARRPLRQQLSFRLNLSRRSFVTFDLKNCTLYSCPPKMKNATFTLDWRKRWWPKHISKYNSNLYKFQLIYFHSKEDSKPWYLVCSITASLALMGNLLVIYLWAFESWIITDCSTSLGQAMPFFTSVYLKVDIFIRLLRTLSEDQLSREHKKEAQTSSQYANCMKVPTQHQNNQ